MCASRAAEDIRPYNTHNIRSSYAVGRDDPARRRRKNAPSSVIAYGDATFPPGWGRLYGRPVAARGHRGRSPLGPI